MLDYHWVMNQSGNQTSILDPQSSILNPPPVLVEVTRGSLIESNHRGFIAVVDASGAVVASLGDIGTPAWLRSAGKPFQTIPVITSGAAARYGFTPRELAVIAGSHSGESLHVEAVLSILNKIGLDESALQCGTHMPFDEASAKRLRAENREPGVLHNNCSGKHSGMLAFAKHTGEPSENYLDPDHPIQRRIRSTLARFAEMPGDEIEVAVDGCSAPVFGLSVEAMARSYARLVCSGRAGIEPELAAAASRVVSAMIEYPEMVGGTRGRLDTDLMLAAKGEIISKVGAEGVQLLGVKPNERYPNGLGVAIKIEDGDIRRARDPVVIETLRQLGLLDEAQLAALARYAWSNIFNYRKIETGEVRTCFKL
jgi:L-asparaginase II